jgi:hypothetical protein
MVDLSGVNITLNNRWSAKLSDIVVFQHTDKPRTPTNVEGFAARHIIDIHFDHDIPNYARFLSESGTRMPPTEQITSVMFEHEAGIESWHCLVEGGSGPTLKNQD